MSDLPVEVFLVDDEPEVLEGLAWLLDSVKIRARTFTSPQAFVDAVRQTAGPLCAALDLRMPEMSGLELQKKLVDEGLDVPLFFLSAHGDIPAAVNAMQLGAADFLQKPFKPQDFLDAVNKVMRIAREHHARRVQAATWQQRIAKLSSRELEILDAMKDGLTSKEIARLHGISPKTVDVHRANVLRKMDVGTTTELQRLIARHEAAGADRPRPG
ncbi:MAG: response regulator transcription factor [Betaproteobacteria bacterium]|nr:MAG: response regulator transcription factor [Betaproteobacteria bacterium]